MTKDTQTNWPKGWTSGIKLALVTSLVGLISFLADVVQIADYFKLPGPSLSSEKSAVGHPVSSDGNVKVPTATEKTSPPPPARNENGAPGNDRKQPTKKPEVLPNGDPAGVLHEQVAIGDGEYRLLAGSRIGVLATFVPIGNTVEASILVKVDGKEQPFPLADPSNRHIELQFDNQAWLLTVKKIDTDQRVVHFTLRRMT